MYVDIWWFFGGLRQAILPYMSPIHGILDVVLDYHRGTPTKLALLHSATKTSAQSQSTDTHTQHPGESVL